MAQDPLYGALSLTRKAGKLAMGFDPVKDQVLSGKAFLVLTAADLSPKTQKRVELYCQDLVEMIPTPLSQAQLAGFARKPVGVLGVLDSNLAALCKNALLKSAAAAAAQIPNQEDKSE